MNKKRLNGVALATINKDELEYENIEIESRNIDCFCLKISQEDDNYLDQTQQIVMLYYKVRAYKK